ncbi:TonB-dependent receptor [Pseudomaricurvus alkylphenolicus]|uniref:TonB-dependent receptor n=1 Tax=Pseudomaricurvus alkylphenolicus TaxID=1306991 RepID=UPI0014232FE3|nr:TonB-dependent receptor [Pseudomaricurvus alkylphenolicus]NIB40294.1 TonB-dependent receptor [Pseudomaricurvus alkylphenolicus]
MNILVHSERRVLRQILVSSMGLLWLQQAQGESELWQESVILQEVIVTAQKREQSLQDVGISITAFSEKQLEEFGLNNSNEIVYLTPGLSLGNPGGEGNITSLSMRGIGQGDFQDIQESPIASYNDEVYNAYMGAANTAIFDLERVEVLRGPQGTLFGRNASGGLVHYISKKPDEEFAANLNLSLGEESHVRFEGGIGGPITDRVYGRLSGFSNKHDPFVKNIGGEDGNEADTQAVRGQLLFKPTDNLDILLKVEAAETEINQWNFEAVAASVDGSGKAVLHPDQPITASAFGIPGDFNDLADGDPFTVNRDATGNVAARGAAPIGLKRESASSSLRVDLTLDNDMTLTSITAYSEHEKAFNQESDGTPLPLIFFGTDTHTEQFSQEIRLAGQTDNMRWVAGAYYLDYEVITVLDVDFFAPDQFFTDNIQQTGNWSVFGQAEYDISDDLTIITGLRYIDEEKELDSIGTYGSVITGGAPLTTSFNPDISPYARIDDDDFAGKIQLNWIVNGDWMLYAGISRGYKAGGFNGPFGAPGISPTFENIAFGAEKPIAYEAGFKSTLLDGKAQWNTSVYYYDYQDFQAFAFLALEQLGFNTDAAVTGIDSELRISPIDGLDFMLGVNILDTKAEDIGNPAGIVRDTDLPNAPTAQVTGLLRYSWSALDGTMAIQGDFNYQSENHFDIFNNPATTIDSYTVGNARLSYTSSDEKWGVALYVKNVSDKEYITSISNNASFPSGLGQVQRFYGRPRWAGVQFTYNLD